MAFKADSSSTLKTIANANGNHAQEPYRDICGKCGARRIDNQIGLEPTPETYVARMVEVFAEVWRVLRNDGCAWVNLGDSFSSGGRKTQCQPTLRKNQTGVAIRPAVTPGLKPKDLVGIPWRVAFALQAAGWYLRDAIIWAKAEVDDDSELEGSAMPGSQRDRCTSAYEVLFQLAKAQRYYFDPEAEKTKSKATLRNVWRINPEPTKIKHFATYPRELVRRCIRLSTSERGCCPHCGAPWERVTETGYVKSPIHGAGSVVGRHYRTGQNNFDGSGMPRLNKEVQTLGFRPTCSCPEHEPVPCIVFDPFVGSGTTLVVAEALGRRAIGCDLSREYLEMAAQRITRPHKPIRSAGKVEHHPLFAGQE